MMGPVVSERCREEELNEHMNGRDEERVGKSEMLFREHPLVIQRYYGGECKPDDAC